ncbi:MAG TPA: glucoamylase family protein, partial [Chthonomonadaceae bacterium]|nr:glucoamylase family protein [Chthonomonadaceae bacterium]
CRTAIACQIGYGRQRNIPWGISEAAYSALDANQVYQYRAFGVPGLGITRGLEQDLVVAPYASALALAVYPAAAANNIAKFSGLSMCGPYGCYESIDYTRQQERQGRRGVPVFCYMAHHQGMILTAIDNALNEGIWQDRFHRNPSVRASESLLYERIPASPAMIKDEIHRDLIPRIVHVSSPHFAGQTDTPNTLTPKTCTLSNGDFSVMVTNAGGGYCRWRDVDINRWTADATADARGEFCYIQELAIPEERRREGGKQQERKRGAPENVWSAAFQPTRVLPQQYTTFFTADKAEFRRRDNGIETISEIVVSPEDNAEIKLITLINLTQRRRRLELTTYRELAMAEHKADKAHLAFSKMFVETEALPDQGVLIAHRRPRSHSDTTVWAAHFAVANSRFDPDQQFETDRARFLGRGRTAGRPEALERDLSGAAGTVMDPIFSLRRTITLEAGERAEIAFVTAAGETREDVVRVVDRYPDLRAISRAIEMAWTHAQLELRHLRIDQNEAQVFQEVASHILYPNALVRPPSKRLALNELGQSRLWAHGISGDVPIAVITIEDEMDIGAIQQLLTAQVYWQRRGLKVDVVILNEEPASYDQPLHHRLTRLADGHRQVAITGRGGVFLLRSDQLPEQERALLLTVARVVLIAARGTLGQLVGIPPQAVSLPPILPRNTRIAEEPSAQLPFMSLEYFNGLGGFTHDGKEYAVYLGPGSQTPMPWINVIANPMFGATVSEAGAGFCWYGNSQSNRLTPWSNDPVSDPIGDVIYIRDEDMGVYWTPTAQPIREQDAFRARHGQGYTIFEHNSHAIEQELTVLVPMDDGGGAPVKLARLKLTNKSSRRRRLTITHYCEWV